MLISKSALQQAQRTHELQLADPRVSLQWSKRQTFKASVITLTPEERQIAIAVSHEFTSLVSIERDPIGFGHAANEIVQRALPAVARSCAKLREYRVPLVIVQGLPGSCPLAATPVDGMVVETDVKHLVGFLVGLLGMAGGLAPFAYRSENGGRILRAVAPNMAQAGKASSQGFDNDLGWHNDNANQPMIDELWFRPGHPFLNPYQAFACVRPQADVPMEVAALDDVLAELIERHGEEPLRTLQSPAYAVRWPDSHHSGGQVAVEGVPVLVMDADGALHSRYHASNVIGMTAEAQGALEMLHATVKDTGSIIEINSEPGDLIAYSNSRTMHRRRAYKPRFDGIDRYYVRLYLAPGSALAGQSVID